MALSETTVRANGCEYTLKDSDGLAFGENQRLKDLAFPILLER
jgi:hypothetical protein